MNVILQRLRGMFAWSANDLVLMVFRSFIPPSAEVQKRNDMNFDTWKIGRDGLLVLLSSLVDSSIRTIQAL